MALDLFNRVTAQIVNEALTMAWLRRKPAPGLIHHFDLGSQYASQLFQKQLKEYGMLCAMSRKGNCWDNAPTESFCNSLKNERVHGTRYVTRAEAQDHLIDYIEAFHNQRRKHSMLACASPMKFLGDWISVQHEEKLAA